MWEKSIDQCSTKFFVEGRKYSDQRQDKLKGKFTINCKTGTEHESIVGRN